MSTLRETLTEHLMRQAGLVPDLDGLTAAGREKWLGRAAEVEAVVLAWVGARLAGAREGVAQAIVDIRDAYPRRADDADSGDVADAALAALRDALGVPVAPAGAEVASEAAGGEIAAESGAVDCEHMWQRQLGEKHYTCPRCGAVECEACPFLGCEGCAAEAAGRANGEAK